MWGIIGVIFFIAYLWGWIMAGVKVDEMGLPRKLGFLAYNVTVMILGSIVYGIFSAIF